MLRRVPTCVRKRENYDWAPSQDECDACLNYEQHGRDCENSENCDICTSGSIHIRNAQLAKEEYDAVDSDVSQYSVDMQKVILLPKLTTKQHFFVSRLVVFNETFAPKNRKKTRFCHALA